MHRRSGPTPRGTERPQSEHVSLFPFVCVTFAVGLLLSPNFRCAAFACFFPATWPCLTPPGFWHRLHTFAARGDRCPMVRAVAASAQKPVEEEEEVTVATMMVYVLALAWLISYASFLWVESLPTELPCAWGIHGCAPHALCQAGWPPSLFSLPSCEQLPPRTLPRNHPPVPAGAGLCSAALASLGAARCRKPRPANGSARVAPRRLRPCQSTPRAAPSSRRPRPLRCSCCAGPCCVGDGVQAPRTYAIVQ